MTSVHAIDELFARFLEHQDEKDLGAVFDLAAPELAAMAGRARLDAVGCEDALQETFLTILRRSHTFDADRRFMPWAQAIMGRQIQVERRRQIKRLRALGLDASDVNADLAPGPRQVLEGSELRQQVEEAIAGLSSTHRDVVGGALLRGESASDLARRMGLSVNAVAVRLHRGLNQIRKVLPRATVLGIAGLMATRARGAMSVRSSITEAARTRTFEAASTRTWWLIPGALATAAGLGVIAVGAWASQAGRDADTPDYVDASVTLPASARTDETEPAPKPDAQDPNEPESRAAIGGGATQDPEPSAATGALSVIQVLTPDGRPAGAGIEVFALATEPMLVVPTEPMTAFATSDAKGRCFAPTERDAGDSTPLLYARSTGDTPDLAGVLKLDLSTLPAHGTVLQLEKALSLEFEVMDEFGRPLEGAEVAALGLVDALFSSDAQHALDQGMLWPIGYRHLFGGVTDELGRCAVRGFLTQGFDGKLIASAAAWIDGRAAYADGFRFPEGEPARLSFTLPSLDSIRLTGQVVDELGNPLAGASVYFNFRGFADVEDTSVAATTSDGTWNIDATDLDWFPIELRFEHEGHVAQVHHIGSPNDISPAPLVITLAPASSLRGRVFRSDGEPAPAELTLVALGRRTLATAGEDGHFLFEGLRGKPGVLYAQSAGEQPRMGALDIESYEEPVHLVLPSDELAPDIMWRAISPDSGEPVPIDEFALLRHGERTGKWPFVEIIEGAAHATDVPPGKWSAVAMLEEDGGTFSLDVEIPATEEPQTMEIPVVPLGALGITISGPPDLETTTGYAVIARRLGPEMPFWVRASNELATQELGLDLFGKVTESVIWIMPGTTDVMVYGPGWVTAPTRCEIRPGETIRLDLEAIRSGSVVLHIPAFDSPGWLSLEVRPKASGSDDWFKVSNALFPPGSADTHALGLPPGRWEWRITCSAFLDEVGTHRAVGQRTGVLNVIAGETVDIHVVETGGQ